MTVSSYKIPSNLIFCYSVPACFSAAKMKAKEEGGKLVAVLLKKRHESQAKSEDFKGGTIYYYSMDCELEEFNIVKSEVDYIICMSDTIEYCV